MSRPQKQGLEYFPLDVSMDDNVELIEAEHGVAGFAILIKMYQKIYSEGYYYPWSEKEQLLFSNKINVDRNTVVAVIDSCIKWGLFDQEMYKKHKILTSKGIQERYVGAVYRRKNVEMIGKYLIIDVSSNNNIVVVGINDDHNSPAVIVSDSCSTQSRVDKSRVDKSRVEDSRKEDPAAADTDYKNVIDFFNNNIHPVTPVEAEKLKDWLNDMESDVIIQAIEEAVIYNKRNYGYIATILNARLKHGIRTKQDLDAYLRDRKDIKNKDAPGKGAFKAPVTTFNSYNQRSYDMEELEKKLLGRE